MLDIYIHTRWCLWTICLFSFSFLFASKITTEAIQRGQQHLCQFKATRVPIMNGLNRRYRRLLVLHRWCQFWVHLCGFLIFHLNHIAMLMNLTVQQVVLTILRLPKVHAWMRRLINVVHILIHSHWPLQ